MKLLHIDSSISGDASASRQISAAIVAGLIQALPHLDLIRRDLGSDPIPHLDAERLHLVRSGIANGASSEIGEPATKEFLAADIVVIGAPMYNFSVPSQLKAWIDRILIAGKTFRYTETGAVGLAGGRKVIIAASRGGLYSPGTPDAANDFHEAYLRAVFRFIGIDDVTIVRAEGLALSPSHREAAIRAALASVPQAVTGFVTRRAA
jgi:FMN-dependent NADH-azoreductase